MNLARTVRLPAALLALACWFPRPGLPASQTIWFGPLDPSMPPWATYSGSVDYFDLFSPSAPWQTAASHVQVFKIYASLVDYFSDDDLRRMFADLDRRGIALAVEFGPLVPENCGFGVEGFNGDDAQHLASRLQQTGGKLRYVAMDEPFYFASIYNGSSACHWNAQKIAANAVAHLALIRQVFSAVQVGDIEPFPTPDLTSLPDWQLRYRAWLDAWKAAAGTPLAFFHSDLNWTNANWRNDVDVLRRYATEHGVPFGIIYNGLGTEVTDADWVNHAEEHFVDYETHGGAPPDHVIFQSWNPHPKHLLPETDPTTLTHLIDRYFRTRAQLSLSGNTASVGGQLTAGPNNPLAGVPVQLTATPLSGPGVVSDYVLSGSVPASATAALVGLRLNLECGCQGFSDLTVFKFQYTENNQSTPQATLDFSSGLNGWGLDSNAQTTLEPGPDGANQGLHIVAQPGQTALLNSWSFAVKPGAPYTLHISARVSPDSAGSGYFTIILLKDVEVSRDTLAFQPVTLTLSAPVTGADGAYHLDLPSLTPDAYEIDAQYSGSDANWPAAASLFVQVVPAVATGGVVNAASYAMGAVSPGEMVTVFGSLLGEPVLTTLQLNADGSMASALSNTRVLFDGIAAPLIYTFSRQTSAIVPYHVAGQATTHMTVEYLGFPSAAVDLAVAGSAPGIFTLDASGRGAGAILNQDFSLNSPAHPAARGSVVMIYSTGEGQTDPPGVDGQIAGTTLPQPRLPVSVTMGGVTAEVLYAGAAPGQVAGMLQVNARVPEGAPVGAAVPLTLTVGTASSQSGVTLAVQ